MDDADMYDEFGNYVGPEINNQEANDSSELSESDQDDSQDQEVGTPSP